MTTQELRIGNWVNNAFGKPLQILGVISEENTGGYKLSTLQPIPLTPEILERCGFENIPHRIVSIWQIPLGRGRFLSIHDVGGGNEIVFISEEEPPVVKNLIVAWNRDYDGRYYLHQLQNLFFALVGEELNYTP